MSSSWSQNNSGGNETTNGSIEISPIEVDLRSVSDTPPRRSVQFSDKVQRFPESAPSSPKPIDASPTSKSVNKTPLDIASESLKQDDSVKKVDIPIQNSDDQQPKNGNKPQIDSFIDVKMEKQNNPDLKIEFNSPLSNSSTTFDHQQQQQSNKQNQQQEDNFKPTAVALPSSSSLNNQPPHVKNEEDKNYNGDFDDKPFVTTVILNVEMVRTPKETEPEDDWDTDTVKLAFSTNASNYEAKTNEQRIPVQEKINDNQSGISSSTSEATSKDQSKESKPPRSPQFGDAPELKEGWNQIDLSPLLKTAPSTDIASINAGLNRASSINEEESTEVNKEQSITQNKEKESDSVKIPVLLGTQSDVNSAETTKPEIQDDKPTTNEISEGSPSASKDSNQADKAEFGIMPHKIVEIPIQFHDDKPVTPIDIPLSEFGIPSEHSTEIVIIFDKQENSTADNKASTLSLENNGSVQNDIIEIPIQFEGQPTVAKVDIPLSQFGTSPLTIFEIPIIFAENDSSKTDTETNNLEITVIEIPIHFEGQEAPTSLKDANYKPASEKLTEIQIIFENQNESSQKSDISTGKLGIEIPIQFEGQPAVAKVDIPLSQHGTPAETTTEIPIIFSDGENIENDNKDVKGEEETTEIAVIQFGFTAQKEEENATASMKAESSDNSEMKQDETPVSSNEKPDEKTDENISGKYKIFEIPIQHEGQPEIQKADIPLSECGIPAETCEEIIIIFETQKEKESGTDENEDKFRFLENKIIEIPIHMEDGTVISKVDIPLSEFGFPAETVREIPIKKAENDEEQSKDKEKESNKFGILPFKVIELPVQHEGKPNVEKVDLPLSEFGTPSESAIEIMIVFEDDKKDNEEKEKVKTDDEEKKSVKDDINKIEQNQETVSNEKDQQQDVTEIPISVDSQNKKESNAEPTKEVQDTSQDTKERNKTNEILVASELQSNQESAQNSEAIQQQQKTESKDEETVTEIPITFEKPNEKQVEQQQPQNNSQPIQEDEKASHEGDRIVPITVERKQEQQFEAPENQEKAKAPSRTPESEPEKSSQFNQEQTAENKEDKVTEVPITVEKPNEQQQPQQTSEEKTSDLTKNQQQEQTPESTGDTIYQTSFAKPMVDESTVTQKQENAEKVPEANDIKYQDSFAKPLSTERKEEKLEEKNEQANDQSNFSKPLTDDSQQNAETKPQPEQTNYWKETSEQKNETPKENQDQKKETIIPIKMEIQQPVSTVPQNETPKTETNKWDSPQIDDKIESSLFSAPSPTTDDDFWIEVPASGVVHQIPISIQQTGIPSNSIQQKQESSSLPATQNQQSTTSADKASKDEALSAPEKKSESSVEQPKSTKDCNIVYNDHGSEQQQPSSGQNSYGNQVNQNEKSGSNEPKSPYKAEDKSSNASQQVDTVRSPTKKYDDNNSIELNIQEYEEQLRKNTQEALNLVDKLCDSSTQQQQERQGRRDREYERRSSQSPTNRDRSRSHSVQFNESQLDAQSYKVNPDLMQEPTAALLLPDFRLALADYQFGLSIFNLHSKDLKRIEGGNKWRRPHNMIYLPRAKQFLVLCEYSEKEDGNYQLFVCRFSSDLEYINRVEAPIFIRDKEILTFRMAYCHRTDCLYLAASTFNTGYIYELAPDGFWREVYTGRNKTFIDISIFAVIGPVTELMLVDTSKDYIVVVSIYNSEAADTRCVAACEKPSALTIDEKGTVIIYDRCSCKVGIHSRLDNLRVHDIALVDHPKCQLSAWDRLLAVLIPSKKDLRLYKY